MTLALRDLWQHRELLYLLVRRDITIRYKQSVMGFLWALLMPAIAVAAGVVVRIMLAGGGRVPPSNVAVLVVKSLPWMFFVSSMRFSAISLTMSGNLVSKMAFPKEVFPLAAVLACGFDFLVAATAAVPVLIWCGTSIGLQTLWVLPLLAIFAAFCIGLALLVSAGNLFYRDVKYIVEVVLSFGIFFTPVLYDVTSLGKHAPTVLLNPIAPLLEGLSASIVHGQAPDSGWISYSLVVSLLILALGYWSFKKMEYLFAERV